MIDINKFQANAGAVFLTLEDTLIKKQLDYGPGNINNAPGGAVNGIIVRMSDKLERIKHLTYHAEGEPNNESLDDSFLDIANYAVIAIMVRNGTWPSNITSMRGM